MIVVTDLDNTVCQTLKRNPSGDVAVSAGRSGAPVSFMTRGQAALVSGLAGMASVVVLATARNFDALCRFDPVIPFGTKVGYAVCSMGRTVLRNVGDGRSRWERVPEWDDRMSKVSPLEEAFLGVLDTVDQGLSGHGRSDVSWSTGIVRCQDGRPAYVKASFTGDGADRAAGMLRSRESAVPGFRVGGYGREAVFIPAGWGKKEAVSFVLSELLPADFVLGMGDSGDDAGFLSLCDYCMIPNGTELWGGICGFKK